MTSVIEIPNKEKFTIKLNREQLECLCKVLAKDIRDRAVYEQWRGDVLRLDFYDAIMEQCGIQETSTDRFLYHRAYQKYKDELYKTEVYEDMEEDNEY